MNRDVLLAVDGLSVQVGTTTLLRDVGFSLRAGEALTLLGESGAGKSLLAQAVMGTLPGALQAGGSVTIAGRHSAAANAHARRPLWGRVISMLPQEPALALDPLMHIQPQVAEVHALVRGRTPRSAQASAMAALDTLGLADAARRYPWQLSGGMAQRAASAVALAGGARILLVDEPTKGLDPAWCAQLIDTLRATLHAGGCVVTITHDLAVAQALGGQVIVLRDGQVVEQGPTAAVLATPRHAFTRRLVAADPGRWPAVAAAPTGARVLQARGLAKRYGTQALFEDLDLDLHAGERVVVQGPSGTGKSTLGNVLLGLVAPDAGTVARAAGLAPYALQKLYQDPVGAFAPTLPLAQSLRDVARLHGVAWPAVLQRLAALRVAESLLARRPGEVSGGELQRVALARILMVRPAVLFADEPTSRLDPVTQQEAMQVLLDAVAETGAALLLVTHDAGIAAAVATRRLQLADTRAVPA